MTTDFKASQVQTNRLIATGSFAGGGANQILVYGIGADDSVAPNQGLIDPGAFDTSRVGSDALLFVSGGISQRNVGGSYGISAFGGDVHISGNLTVDGTYPAGGGGGGNEYWESEIAGEIYTSGSVFIRAGEFGNENRIIFNNSASNGAVIGVEDILDGSSLSANELDLRIQAGSANEEAPGGNLILWGGLGGMSSTGDGSLGGSVEIRARQGGSGLQPFQEGGYGGTVNIAAGAGGNGDILGGEGGFINISAGLGGAVSDVTGDAGQGGTIQLIAGNGGLNGGAGTGATGGSVAIEAGNGGMNDGAGGNVTIGAGSATQNGAGGVLWLAPGGASSAVNSRAGDALFAAGSIPVARYRTSGSNLSLGGLEFFGSTTKFRRIFVNRYAGDDAGIIGLPLPTDIADTFFYVSGGIGQKDGTIPAIALFGGDVHISGNLTVDGTYPAGGGGGAVQWEDGADRLATTSSIAIAGDLGPGYFADNAGSDVFFYVSGSTEFPYGVALFGGHVVTSGSFRGQYGRPALQSTIPGNDIADIIGIFDGTGGGVGSKIVAFGDFTRTTGFGYVDSSEIIAVITGSDAGYFSGSYSFPQGISGSLTRLTDGTSYLVAGVDIDIVTASNGQVTISSTGGSGGLVTGKQHAAAYTATTTTVPQAIGQFSWVPSDYTGLTSITVRAVMSTDGTTNLTGSLQIYNFTSGTYIDLVDDPIVSKHMIITSSTPTAVTSSNLLIGESAFGNLIDSIYEVRVSGSLASQIIVGGAELVFS